jgi:hypothetical protein
MLTAAFASWTNAHSTVIRAKNRRTGGEPRNVDGSGQKSPASRSARGRPAGTDKRNTLPISTVVSVGCRKYTNTLPDTRATTVRAVMPTTPRISSPGTGVRVTRRRITAVYDHASAAMSPPQTPTSHSAP